MVWILFILLLGTGLVVFRRVVAAEALRLRAHPFLVVVVIALVVGVPVLTELLLLTRDVDEEGYRRLTSFLIFGISIGIGFKLAAVAAVIFGSLSFAAEFDRGTIRNLLTRPVTREELFAGKCCVQIAVAVGLGLLVVTESAVWASLRGELHHVWRGEVFEIYPSFEEMMAHARRAAGLLFLPLMTTSLLGVAVSNMTESSGGAVAMALIALLLTAFAGEGQPVLFTYYPAHGSEMLQLYALGDARAGWAEAVTGDGWDWKVPLGTAAACVAAGYFIFRTRNITA